MAEQHNATYGVHRDELMFVADLAELLGQTDTPVPLSPDLTLWSTARGVAAWQADQEAQAEEC
jgi:hypothetical protein